MAFCPPPGRLASTSSMGQNCGMVARVDLPVNEMARLYREGASLKKLAAALRRRGRNNTKPACGGAGTTTSPRRTESTC